MKKIRNKKTALTGGAASAEALRQIIPDVMPVYPITPQTPIIETFAKFKADGRVDTEIITVESEHSAISACVGSSSAGARTVTATSSQGLALMNEILYIASGMHLPIMMLVSSRALSAPINIHGDHSDVMGARDAGWIQLFSENAQEVYDNTIIGMRLAEIVKNPVMVIMDGFTTSHTVENLEILSDTVVRKFIGKYTPKDFLLNINNPKTFGPVGLPDSYFEFKIVQNEKMNGVSKQYNKISEEYQKISERKYHKLEAYKTKDAEQIMVLMGSTAGTVKDVVDEMRLDGKKVGLLKIRMFRPFPYKEVVEILKKAKSVAVLERVMSIGSVGPLYSEVITSLQGVKNMPTVSNYIYGLGGRDIFAKQIEEVFEDMINKKYPKKITFIK